MRYILVLLLVTGCAGDCIKIGGSYDGFTGAIEYCFSTQQSQIETRPVLTSSSGGEAVVLSRDDIEGIRDAMVSGEVTEKSTKTATQQILEHVRKYRKYLKEIQNADERKNR